MSGGGGGAGTCSNSRVSIPKSIRTMIQSIKEMTAGNHPDDEIHAMLKECSMDPNETAQRLLLLDPFHEVKPKRAKRKENLKNQESSDSRHRAGTQGKGGRGGRGIFPSRYNNDAGDGKTANAGKESGAKKVKGKGVIPSSLRVTQKIESTTLASVSSSLGGASNGPTHVSDGCAPEGLVGSAARQGKLTPNSDQSASPGLGHGVYSSASDPVLVPSLDSRFVGTVANIKRDVGSQRPVTDANTSILGEDRSTATVGSISSE